LSKRDLSINKAHKIVCLERYFVLIRALGWLGRCASLRVRHLYTPRRHNTSSHWRLVNRVNNTRHIIRVYVELTKNGFTPPRKMSNAIRTSHTHDSIIYNRHFPSNFQTIASVDGRRVPYNIIRVHERLRFLRHVFSLENAWSTCRYCFYIILQQCCYYDVI